MGVGHYENFPVASVLCPARLRPAVIAIYRFARTADDLADEGSASSAQRLEELGRYRTALRRAATRQGFRSEGSRDTLRDTSRDTDWPEIFAPLAQQIRQFDLPMQWLHALLDAFEQDARNPAYPDREALLDYCRRSANPVGRLLLHLYGIDDADSLARSDAICTALQLINFWQDLGIDGPRGRCYAPVADRERHGVSAEELRRASDSPRSRALVRELCDWAEALMHSGAPLALHIPGRAGWELRLVVQGGLRILEKIRRIDHASLAQRPRIVAADLPLLLWRAWRMPSPPVGRARGAVR